MTRPLHIRMRLAVAGLLLVGLVYALFQMSAWRSIEHEIHLTFLEGAMAALVVVVLVPIIRRGDLWSRVLAGLFLVIPAMSLLDAIVKGIGTVLNLRFGL